ncbi:hypothetical protein GCM10023331_26930 [Algivirga pacifica]|uniref:Right handed beta helix domain-containing protein n=1 Tax=Algivirga pacifica TaxID=1162670 RepID=A0ABP9DFG1_9BACT
MVIKNIKGTAEQPIVIQNCDGVFMIKQASDKSFGLKVQGSSYFRLTGSGAGKEQYGIKIEGGNIGVQMIGLSTNFELDHMEVSKVGFAGIMAKTDPTCAPETWRDNFTMEDVRIHDNYVHETGTGEGFYIGNSFYAGGMKKDCGKVYPHKIVNLKLYNNLVEDTGAEGIQVGCAVRGCEIYGNKVFRAGVNPFNGRKSQQNGIQIGEGTGGRCYNNLVVDASANAIIVLGLGDNVLYNNILVRPAGAGIFIDERPPSTVLGKGSGFRVINNTIIEPGKHGIWIYAELVQQNDILNNIIAAPRSGKFITFEGCPGVPVINASNNLKVYDPAQVKFVGYQKGDFRLSKASPALGKGKSVHHYGVETDFYNHRISTQAIDVGAIQYTE